MLCLVFAEGRGEIPRVAETIATNFVGHGDEGPGATFPELVMAAHWQGDCVPRSPPCSRNSLW